MFLDASYLCIFFYLIVRSSEMKLQLKGEAIAGKSFLTNFGGEITDKSDICYSLNCPELEKQDSSIHTTLQLRFQYYLGIYLTFCKNFEDLDRLQKENILKLERTINALCNRPATSINLFGFKCPAPLDIAPCICNSATATLDCSDVGSFTEVKSIISNATFPNTIFKEFNYQPAIPSRNERIFPNNTFGPLSFESISISKSGVKEIAYDAFSGSQTTLKIISFETNENLQIFPFTALTDFLNLEILNIIDGDISDIPNIGTIPKLKLFWVISSRVKSVQNEAFANLRQVTIIDLSSNQLGSVHVVFSGWNLLSRNVSIFLDSNELYGIPIFANHQPIILDASSNLLTTFTETDYAPILDNGAMVNVKDNSIACSEFGWVTTAQNKKILSDCTHF